MNADSTFTDEQTAACWLLEKITTTFKSNMVNFVVVGGWNTYLFNRSLYGHPGTFDVDLLIHSESITDKRFTQATDRLLADGFMRAAKNPFQIHIPLNINDERILFHADFLNEQNPDNVLEIVTGSGRVKSIYTKSMELIFKYQDYRSHPDFEGIQFPSIETFIATKAQALTIQKRRRDAFDIYISLQSIESRSEFAERWRNLVKTDGGFENANDLIWKSIFDEHAEPETTCTCFSGDKHAKGNSVDKIIEVLRNLQVPSAPSSDDVRNLFRDILKNPSEY